MSVIRADIAKLRINVVINPENMMAYGTIRLCREMKLPINPPVVLPKSEHFRKSINVSSEIGTFLHGMVWTDKKTIILMVLNHHFAGP